MNWSTATPGMPSPSKRRGMPAWGCTPKTVSTVAQRAANKSSLKQRIVPIYGLPLSRAKKAAAVRPKRRVARDRRPTVPALRTSFGTSNPTWKMDRAVPSTPRRDLAVSWSRSCSAYQPSQPSTRRPTGGLTRREGALSPRTFTGALPRPASAMARMRANNTQSQLLHGHRQRTDLRGTEEPQQWRLLHMNSILEAELKIDVVDMFFDKLNSEDPEPKAG